MAEDTKGDRIAQARRAYPGKMSQADLGARIGKSRGMVARYETNLDDPPIYIAQRISEVLGVRLSWLLEGSGNMAGGITLEGAAEESTEVDLPYWGEVPAGAWQSPLEDLGKMPVDRTLGKTGRVVVRVAGDSMYPRLQHGDEVIVQTSKTPKEGVITLAQNGDAERTLKVLKHVNGRDWELHPINPSHEPAVSAQWEILGYAVSIKRHFGPNRYLLEVDDLGIRP